MRALVIDDSTPRLAATKLLAAVTPSAYVGPLSPLRLREIPPPALPGPDWAVGRTRLCGLCGSDYKQVFMNGAFDNPMTAMISWPQVLGHEVVAEIDQVGPGVTGRRVGERVVLNPWLSCATRGLAPCEWCRGGDFAQCLNFTRGNAARGIHSGNSATATGGFASRVPAHESQWIPIPDDVTDEAAVLADPFSVSLHAILRVPPPPEGIALVYGAGTLGLMAVAILRALHPGVRVAVVARFAHQGALAARFGAERVLCHRPTRRLLDELGELTKAELHRPWRGLPMLGGGVDVVYDTVSSPETFEVGVRATRSRGHIVALGVEPPRRFEWTPLYFKELSIVGSNGFGMEDFQGHRQHAIEWYFELIRTRGVDVTPVLTHRFPLESYREAFMACYAQGDHESVKVLFDGFPQ